ncbi:GSCOCG00000395001-RA-CDS [Cotesia congregata]|uniref:Uncharacterized protein n=1 Tax=Cotesia congregata TaxID=51543 RepID=A0A8J2MFF8_COTCN|nr:GSCOCG00000395001-RA-CDS [Cotesia congregata]CAG5088145.1 Protein of unknown function [Cotesia congregata]
MFKKNLLIYLAIGFLILGCFINQVEARRKILRGRKTITRQYYRGLAIPAWSIVVLTGLAMLTVGGGLYVALKKIVVDSSDDGTTNSYHPAIQDDV